MQLIELLNEIKKGTLNLTDIQLLVSKEENHVMNGEDFRSVLTLEPNQDMKCLEYKNSDDLQLVGEIDMQWYVFKKY